MSNFQFTAHLQRELRDGKLNATLSDLNWPLGMQQKLNSANTYLEAAFILYIFYVIFLLSTIIPSAIIMFLTNTYQSVSPKMCILSIVSRLSLTDDVFLSRFI